MKKSHYKSESHYYSDLKKRHTNTNLRRNSRIKIAGDEDVKFFFQIAVIMGFTFVMGFFQTLFNSNVSKLKLDNQDNE